jgi:hypothetical protein
VPENGDTTDERNTLKVVGHLIWNTVGDWDSLMRECWGITYLTGQRGFLQGRSEKPVWLDLRHI